MKKIKICMIGIIIIVSIFVVVQKNLNKKDNDKKLVKQIFGIDLNDYQVMEINNSLYPNKYDGKYAVKLKVKEEQIDVFISKIKEAGFYQLIKDGSEEEKEIYYSQEPIVKNLSGKDIEDVNLVFSYMGDVKRHISLSNPPKTVMGDIVCSKYEDGDYEVNMQYYE